jgi:hypothetical protein
MTYAKLENALDLLRTLSVYLDNVANSKYQPKKGENQQVGIAKHLRQMSAGAAIMKGQINAFLGENDILTHVLNKMQADGRIMVEDGRMYLVKDGGNGC